MFQFGIVGCGSRAAFHAAQINRIGKLVAVCDTDSQKAAQLAGLYQVPAYSDMDDLLKNSSKVDIICVCTPTGCHAEHCIKALQSGYHVLCEGPLCITSAAAWQMLETEKFSRKKLLLCNPVNSKPDVVALKKKITDVMKKNSFFFGLHVAAIPDLERKWQHQLFPGGGALYAYFSGYVDLIIYLFGALAHAEMNSAKGLNKGVDEVEASGEAILEMKSGVRGKLHWNLGEPGHNQLIVTSSSASITIPETELDNLMHSDEKSYSHYYNYLIHSISAASSFSDLHEPIKTVEAIEKIYKAVSYNYSNA